MLCRELEFGRVWEEFKEFMMADIHKLYE